MNSQELFQRAQRIAPGGVHSPVRAFKSVGGTPVFFNRAQGAYMDSVEGDRYLDFCQSFGPLMLGHRDPEVVAAVHEILEQAMSFGACEPYSLALAEWITERVPWVQKIRFVSSGTEAVMSAIRVARAATGRSKILKFDGCYHGHADALLVKAGSGLAGEASSDSAGVPEWLARETLVCPLDDVEALRKIFETHGHEIALVAIEPLPANFGLLPQTNEFLNEVARLAKQAQSLLLFDEVISGFRVAMGGMAELTGIKPDLVCYGKVIGGGFPVGAYGGRADLMDLVAPSGRVYQAGTLSANPVGMVAGLTTLKKIERENAFAVLEQRGARFTKALEQVIQKTGAPLKMVRRGSLFWIHGSDTAEPRHLGQITGPHRENFPRFFHACLKRKLYLAPSGFEVGFLSLAHTDAIIDEAVSIFDSAIQEVFG